MNKVYRQPTSIHAQPFLYSYLVMGNVGGICMTVINFTLSLGKCFHGICLFKYIKQYKWIPKYTFNFSFWVNNIEHQWVPMDTPWIWFFFNPIQLYAQSSRVCWTKNKVILYICLKSFHKNKCISIILFDWHTLVYQRVAIIKTNSISTNGNIVINFFLQSLGLQQYILTFSIFYYLVVFLNLFLNSINSLTRVIA